MTSEPRNGTRLDRPSAPRPGAPRAHGRSDNRAASDAPGCAPAWLRAGALVVVPAAIAAAPGRLASAKGGVLMNIATPWARPRAERQGFDASERRSGGIRADAVRRGQGAGFTVKHAEGHCVG